MGEQDQGRSGKPGKGGRDGDVARVAGLLGVGLDGDDGHVRVTRTRNAHLVGGSEETHEALQETAVKVEEQLDRKGKRLRDCHPDEVREMIEKALPDA